MADHSPGPWKICGSDRGGCQCFIVWSEGADHPVATVENGKWGDPYPAVRPVGSTKTPSIDNHIQLEAGWYEVYTELIEYGHVPIDVAKANYWLIAAAPDLLVATRRAIQLIEKGLKEPTLPTEDREVLVQLVSAVKKYEEGR